MFIIARYILRALIGPFLFGACTVMFVFLLQFLMNYLPQFVGKGLGTWVIIKLIALNLSWMVVLAIPLGALVSTLMAFGNLSAANEILIVKSGGGSLLRMMTPVITASIILSLALFWFNDYVLPDANYNAQILMTDIQRKKPTFAVDAGQFSTQIEGYSILARQMDTSRGILLGVTIYDNTKLDRMNVVSADSGRINFSSDFSKLILLLTNGEIHQINQVNFGDYRKIVFTTHQIVMDANGFAFARTDEKTHSRGDRTMNIADMRRIVRTADSVVSFSKERMNTQTEKHQRYIIGEFDSLLTSELKTYQLQYSPAPTPQLKTVVSSMKDITKRDSTLKDSVVTPSAKLLSRQEAAWRVENRVSGLRSLVDGDLYQMHDRELEADKFLVEIWKKYSIPAACFVFVLVGCPLGIITRRGNFGVSGALTLIFYVIYWMFLVMGEKLADRGLMLPWLSMWLADIVIGVVGVVLMIGVSRENYTFGLERYWWRMRKIITKYTTKIIAAYRSIPQYVQQVRLPRFAKKKQISSIVESVEINNPSSSEDVPLPTLSSGQDTFKE